MIRTTDLSKEEKSGLEALLKHLRLLPGKNCQIVLHCAQGTLQSIEFSKLQLK